jgi:hypothetical protein
MILMQYLLFRVWCVFTLQCIVFSIVTAKEIVNSANNVTVIVSEHTTPESLYK